MSRLKELSITIIKLNAEQHRIALDTDGPDHTYADGQRRAYGIILNEIRKLMK